jgi:FKBP-type peptidyl-prolyl cis-trans isomerase
VAAVVAAVLVGGGFVYLHHPGTVTENWYAAGKSAELASEQADDGLLTGPVSVLTKECTANLNAATPSQRPAATDNAGVQQWLQGCAAGYHQDHPGQVIQDGVMYGDGTQTCTGSCASPAGPVGSNGAVTVTGAFGTAPTVGIPAQSPASSLYVKTLIRGTGATLTTSEGLIGNYVSYDWSGKTHKLLGSSYQQRTSSLFVGKLLPGLEKALIGQPAGSRVLAVIPPADAFGRSGDARAGIGGTDTLVFVVDMISTFSTDGVPGAQTSEGGGSLPTVTPPAAGATSGPAITIPAASAPPGNLEVSTLIHGTGPVVQAGQDIAVQYTGVIWRTGKVFQSSWASNAPLSTEIGEGQVIKGWDTGLVGQTVGSRVLLVIPPADAYGSAGEAQVGIKGGDTLVFVVDILAAT